MTGNLSFEKADAEAVWIAQADSQGPTVAILGGVHGDEPAGIEVVKSSLNALAIDTGTVILMLGNMAAQGVARFKDVNLNRSFRELTSEEQQQDFADLPYEVQRAQTLLPYLDTSDAALDLHDFTNPSKPFIITERNGLQTARYIGAPIISFGWTQTEPGGSDGYMSCRGKEGLCYELGQKQYPQQNIARGHGAVQRFLISQGLLEGDVTPLFDNPELVETSEAFIRTADNFAFVRDFGNFELLNTGEPIAVHGDNEIRASEGQVIIFPMKDAAIGEEAFTLGRRLEL